MADRVAIIDHGQLLTVDTPEALKRTVGEGDVLEIELNNETIGAASAGTGIDRAADVHHATIPWSSGQRGVVELLPAILEALQTVNASPGEVRLRANSLEDVFLSLTGRRLRE